MTTALLPLSEVKPPIPGGEHQVLLNADGSAVILDVPIFCEHVVTGDGQEIHLTREWMEAAIVRCAKREVEDNYLAPLHINHHNTGRDVDAAGFYRLREIRLAEYEGELLWTMFADLIVVDAELYSDKIRRSRLPYRSVEIHDVREPEIDSLALMADEVPFYRLSLLTVGEELDGPVAEAHEIPHIDNFTPLPVAARALGHHGVALLFRSRGDCKNATHALRRYGWPAELAKGIMLIAQLDWSLR